MIEISDLLLRRLRTALLYLAMICLGMCTAIPGPTLLDLGRSIHSKTDQISFIYIGRSIGYLLGSFFGGVVLDYLQKPQLLLLLFSLTMSVCTLIIPWCKSLQVLIGIMSLSGSAMGALDTGLNVWCLDIWNDESSPYFQSLHFFFGLGAFLGPIIAGPFLSHNNTQPLSVSSQSNVTFPVEQNHVPAHFETSNITSIYSIIGTISLVVSLLFALLFLTSVKLSSTTEKLQYKDPKKQYKIMILSCAFLLLSVYAGIEIGFGQMIAIYAVRSTHKFSESLASYFTSLYWGTFTFSRALSILLSLKFTPLTLIIWDSILMCFAATLLVLFGNVYKSLLWVGSAILGFAFASFYPTVITWVEKYVNINNKVGSYFVVAASIGEMIAPITISQYVNEKPEFLLYATLTSVGICMILIFILWVFMSHIGVKQLIRIEKHSKYEISELISETENVEQT